MTSTRDEIRYLSRIFLRDLETLADEIGRYPSEPALWVIPPGTPNSGGTLALHLVGNLQHFIGAQLGQTGYVRNREAEFQSRDVPRDEIVARVRATMGVVEQTLAALTPEALAAEYPLAVANARIKTEDFLLHLASHLAYHLGQLDYHRRLVTRQPTSAGAMSPARLYSARPVS